jgi:hypothetical protein
MAKPSKLPLELRLGAIAVRMGFLSAAQLEDAVAFQERRGMQEHLGSILLMLEYLTPKTLAQVLAEQKRGIEKVTRVDALPTSRAAQRKFGDIAVELGLVTREHLEEAVRIQQGASPKPFLGAVLLDLGRITTGDIARILACQFDAQPGAPEKPAVPVSRLPSVVARLADGPAGPPVSSSRVSKPVPLDPAEALKELEAQLPKGRAVPASPKAAAPRPLAPPPRRAPTANVKLPPLKAPEDVQIGHIAVRLGLLTVSELNEALDVQGRRSPKPFLGALLVELGYLSSKALAQVLAEQVSLMAQLSKVASIPRGRAEEGKFGKIAIGCGFISKDQLEEALGIQTRSSPKPFLGAVLVDLGYMSPRQLSKVLAAQAAGEGFNST